MKKEIEFCQKRNDQKRILKKENYDPDLRINVVSHLMKIKNLFLHPKWQELYQALWLSGQAQTIWQMPQNRIAIQIDYKDYFKNDIQ